MTPRSVGSMLKRRGERDQDATDRFAHLQALLMNAHFNRRGRPWTAQEFGARRPSPESQALIAEGNILQAEIDSRIKQRAVPSWARVNRGDRRA